MAYRHKSYADKLFIRINRAILCRQGPCPHSDDSSRDELIFRGSYADKKFRLYKLVAKIRKSLTIPTRNLYLLLALILVCWWISRDPVGILRGKIYHASQRGPHCVGRAGVDSRSWLDCQKNSTEHGSTRLTWGVLFFPRTTLESPPQQRWAVLDLFQHEKTDILTATLP